MEMFLSTVTIFLKLHFRKIKCGQLTMYSTTLSYNQKEWRVFGLAAKILVEKSVSCPETRICVHTLALSSDLSVYW